MEDIVVSPDDWEKYGLSDMPAARIGSRLLTREEYSSQEVFERILLEQSGISLPVTR
ncbi:MAG: hypothetical protein AABY87_06840 [bacterium]